MMNSLRNYRSEALSYLLLALLLVLVSLTVLAQANPGTRLPGRDYGFYAYIGDQILHGKLPYRDAWESKPPAIFYLNALALWIGRGSRWGIWLIELAALLAAGFFSYVSVKKLWGILPALGTLLFWATGFQKTLEGGNLTEEYPLPLHFLSILLFLKLVEVPRNRLYAFLLGLAFGLSFLFRPNNAVVEAAVLITLFFVQALRRDWHVLLTQFLWIGLGSLVPILVTGFYFGEQGLLRDLLEASFLYNLTYSSTAMTSSSPLISGFQIFGWLAWIAAAGYMAALYYAIRLKQPVYFLLLIGWPMVIFMSDPARRNYAHYFMNWLPFMSLLGGLAIYFLIQHLPLSIKRPLSWEKIALGLAVIFSVVFLFTGGGAAEYQKALDRIGKRDTLGVEVRSRQAAYVENHTKPQDLVLFWAASPGENLMSNRATPNASLFYPLYVPSDISKRLNDRFLQDIQTKRPLLIVDIGDHEALSLDSEQRAKQIADGFAWEYPPDNLEQFFQFVAENYYVEAKIGNKTVYRLYGSQ